MPPTGALIGTPASIRDSVEPQTEPIEDEPFDSSVSETSRIVYGNSSGVGITGSSARWASAPWPMSRRFGPRMKPVSPTENGGEMLRCITRRGGVGAEHVVTLRLSSFVD